MLAKFIVKLHSGIMFEANHLENCVQNSGTEGVIPMLSFMAGGERRVVRADSVSEVVWYPTGTAAHVG